MKRSGRNYNMKVKDYIAKHPEILNSRNLSDLITLVHVNLLIDDLLDTKLQTQITNYIDKKIEEIREKEL